MCTLTYAFFVLVTHMKKETQTPTTKPQRLIRLVKKIIKHGANQLRKHIFQSMKPWISITPY